jgi:diguanylate cyclase (GGDEF)-like protein
MSARAAADPSADPLPPELVLARQELSAARFAAACQMAAPVFHAARDSHDWPLAAEAALLLARARSNQRLGEDALRWGHEALQASGHSGRPDLVCASWVALAREHARVEEGAAALHAVDEVLALVSRLQTSDALESTYIGLTAIYSDLGLTSLAVSCARHALPYAEALSARARVVMSRTNLLTIGCEACEQLQEPDPGAARRLREELLPHLERLRAEVPLLGSPLAQGRLHRVAGILLCCDGRPQEARREFEALVAMAGNLPPVLVCSGWIGLGMVQRELGLIEEARASGRAALAVNPVTGAAPTAAELKRLSQIHELLGDAQQALELLRSHQNRRHHLVMSALESRAAALSVQLDEQSLRVENLKLRRRNASLRAKVQDVSRMASTDPLTGLLNRRGLQATWSRLAGGPGRVLAMIDLDHFKRINDDHSHATGDAVLQLVARLMEQTLRAHDHLARVGGEEFAALLCDVDLALARQAVERLREAVARHDWHAVAPGIRVTVSIGLVGIGADEPLDAVLARADQLLYTAKNAGRNRVASA